MKNEVLLKVGSVLKGWNAIVTFITDDHYYAMYESLDGKDKQISTTDYIYDAAKNGEIEIVNDVTHFKKNYIVTVTTLSNVEMFNGHTECALFETVDAAKEKLAEWRQSEIDTLTALHYNYKVIEDEDNKCRIDMNIGTEHRQRLMEVHETLVRIG